MPRIFNLSKLRQNSESAAIKFCSKIRTNELALFTATNSPERLKQIRVELHSFRDDYNRARGDGFGSPAIRCADKVSLKIAEILNRDVKDWNNYGRAQQFRWLDETLVAFEIEASRSGRTANAPANVVKFPSRGKAPC